MITRFAAYIDGLSTLSLSPGESVEFSSGYDNGEGYTRRHTSFEFDSDAAEIRMNVSVYSTDCDGRSEHHTSANCYVHSSGAIELHPTNCAYDESDDETFGNRLSDIRIPNWQITDSSQRDHAAEAMGY